MVGPQYASVKQQLGPLLNGFMSFETFVPEPMTNFPGIKEFLSRYKPKAIEAGVDALGYYLPPFSYAGMQILAAAAETTKSFDQNKMADYIHKTTHRRRDSLRPGRRVPDLSGAVPEDRWKRFGAVRAARDTGHFVPAGLQVRKARVPATSAMREESSEPDTAVVRSTKGHS